MTTIAGHLTYILIGFSYLLRDIVWLRVVALIASVLSILFNYFAPADPLWLPIGWNCLFVFINAYHLLFLMRNKPQHVLRAEEIDLARTFFGGASPTQLSSLFRCGYWRELKSGETITRQGRASSEIGILYTGSVEVTVDGVPRGESSQRSFIGEISYLTGDPISATLKTTSPTQLLCWSVRDLRLLLSRDEQLNSLFQNWMAVDLTRKLKRGERESSAELELETAT